MFISILNLIQFIIISITFNFILLIINLRCKSDKLNNKKPLSIYVNPWFLTKTPFFLISLSLLLFKRGYKIDLIFDDFQIYKRTKLFVNITNFFILSNCFFLKLLCKNKVKLTLIQNQKIIKNQINNNLKNYLSNLLKANIYRLTRNENEYKKWDLKTHQISKEILIRYNQITSYILKNKNNFFIIPGGIANSTEIYTNYLKRKKINFLTIDNAKRNKKFFLFLCLNGIAAKREDGLEAYNLIDKSNSTFKKIKKFVNREIKNRSKGKDSLVFQKNESYKFKENNFILILLSSGWDSSSLMTHKIFNDNGSWLKQTLFWINKKYKNQKIVIREHPHLRIKEFKSNDDFSRIYEKGKNIILHDSFSNVNTYDLIKNCKFIITTVSTSGIEAVILGKKAIFAGKCIFEKFNFFTNLKTKNEYFNEIIKLQKIKKMRNEIKKKAIYCYFFCDYLKMIETKFCPDYMTISPFKINEVVNSVTLDLLVKTMNDVKPFPYINLKHYQKKNV